MNRTAILPLAIIAGLYLQPLALRAQDEGQDMKDKTSAGHPAKAEAKDLKSAKHAEDGTERSKGPNPDASFAKSRGSKDVNITRSTDAGTLNDSNTRRSVQQTESNQSSTDRSSTFAVRGNQSNHYDGQWVSADSHGDWDVHSEHNWHHHHYRYYDGGWLLIDIEPSPDIAGGGSTGSNVQASLAQQGYYHGPIDGDIGPGTRRAIAHYEVDNGLPPNGVIDEPLLVSLKLE
jgi:hypothetical protein